MTTQEFGEQVAQLRPGLVRFIYFRVRDRDWAEDIAQEAMLRAILHQSKYRPQSDRTPCGSLRGWLYGIAVHVVHDYWRRHTHWETVSLDEPRKGNDGELSPMEIASHLPDAYAQLLGEQTWGRIQEAIEKLSPKRRSVVQLCVFEEMKSRDVALHLGIDDSTVCRRLHGAIRQIAQHCGIQIEKPEPSKPQDPELPKAEPIQQLPEPLAVLAQELVRRGVISCVPELHIGKRLA